MSVSYTYSRMYGFDPIVEEHIWQEKLKLDEDGNPETPLNLVPKLKPKPLPEAKPDPLAIQILQALLDAGANPDLKDKQGFTPRDLAKAAGEYEMITKIIGPEAQHLEAMVGASSIMHGGATYWVTVQGGYTSTQPLQLIVNLGAKK